MGGEYNTYSQASYIRHLLSTTFISLNEFSNIYRIERQKNKNEFEEKEVEGEFSEVVNINSTKQHVILHRFYSNAQWMFFFMNGASW